MLGWGPAKVRVKREVGEWALHSFRSIISPGLMPSDPIGLIVTMPRVVVRTQSSHRAWAQQVLSREVFIPFLWDRFRDEVDTERKTEIDPSIWDLSP
jgi:hypothetical protein